MHQCIILTALYSVFVLSYVWWHCYTSPFVGGKNGPLDAYRHTLASAVVAYTTTPKFVKIVTFCMENENHPANLMDKHNNKIGTKIGVHAVSFSTLPKLVNTQILQGKVNAPNQNQTTWLPENKWAEGFFW